MKLLICGTRCKPDEMALIKALDELVKRFGKPELVIEGCCPESADVVGEKWAEANKIKIKHFPSTSGNYLKRNIEMVEEATILFALWDGFSYGTAHTIAHATRRGLPCVILKVDRKGVNK